MPPITRTKISGAGQMRAELLEALAIGHARIGRTGALGLQPRDDGDGDAIAHRRKDARNDRREEQLGDVLLGEDRVDDQDPRRRHEDADGAAGGKRARWQARPNSRGA